MMFRCVGCASRLAVAIALMGSVVVAEAAPRPGRGYLTGPPLLSFSGDPSAIAAGESTLLSWASVNARQCDASGGWSGRQPKEGTFRTPPLNASTEFTLTCIGRDGQVSETVVVNVEGVAQPAPEPTPAPAPAPTMSFTSSAAAVTAGETVTLDWVSENTTGCTADGAWSGAKTPSGQQVSASLETDSTFMLTCSGDGGSVSQSIAVSVTAPPPVASLKLTASPTSVSPNGSTTLSWAGEGVDACQASGGWSGTKASSGSVAVGPISADTSFSLECSGPGGKALAMTTVSVKQAQLSWEAPTENVDGSPLTDLVGFTVHYGQTSRSYDRSVTVDNPSQTQVVLPLELGEWFFAVTASDAQGNTSALSNEVSKVVGP